MAGRVFRMARVLPREPSDGWISRKFALLPDVAAAGINEVPGGHPEDLKPEQSGSN